MTLPINKTKIVTTIGPASCSLEMIERMIEAGMNVARLNFSHGDFPTHIEAIKNIRLAEKKTNKFVAIMADLPGPKMRIGYLNQEPIELKAGQTFTLTTREIVGDTTQASVSFKTLPSVVKKGDSLFLNDGLICLEVQKVDKENIVCQIVVGGELRSKKGLNLPGIELGISAFTERDKVCLKVALENGVDAVSQSFVDSEKDIEAVRNAAKALGKIPFIIAKIERSGALKNLDRILEAADGIMVARGDLGVETPFEQMAILQKNIIREAVWRGKPVITATQMLESMITNRQPTRAEATDVANAVLDGTDAVMLSGESALGKYPVESIGTLARIAAATEPFRVRVNGQTFLKRYAEKFEVMTSDLLSVNVESTIENGSIAAVIVPSQKGSIVRRIARFKLPIWVTAVTPNLETCRQLQFSYGVMSHCLPEPEKGWGEYARNLVNIENLSGKRALVVQGTSAVDPNRLYHVGIIEL